MCILLNMVKAYIEEKFFIGCWCCHVYVRLHTKRQKQKRFLHCLAATIQQQKKHHAFHKPTKPKTELWCSRECLHQPAGTNPLLLLIRTILVAPCKICCVLHANPFIIFKQVKGRLEDTGEIRLVFLWSARRLVGEEYIIGNVVVSSCHWWHSKSGSRTNGCEERPQCKVVANMGAASWGLAFVATVGRLFLLVAHRVLFCLCDAARRGLWLCGNESCVSFE